MKVGNTVKIKAGILDPDTDLLVGGFVGRIKEYLASDLVNIAWDSISLQKLSDTYIRSAIDEGCDYLSYNIGTEELEVCEARDTPADVLRVIRELATKWDRVEEFGDLAELIEEIEEEGWEEYLTEEITFPFMAEPSDKYGKFRSLGKVKILSIHDEDDHYGLIMRCKKGRSTVYVPLCELEATNRESDHTKGLIDLYREYFWNR
ncbi:MAG: calcium-binding protein [Bacteroidota bacterium]